MREKRWIYQAGKHNAQTVTYVDADGIERCAWTKDKAGNPEDYTVEAYLAYLNERREDGSPEFVCLTWDELAPLIEAVMQNTYKIGTMQEVSEERFIEMLEVLPPMQWTRSKTSESFKLEELTSGDITACFVRIGARYFEGYGRVSTPSDRLIDWAAMEYGRLYPEEYAAQYTAA